MNRLFSYELSDRLTPEQGARIQIDAPLPCLILLLGGFLKIKHAFSGKEISPDCNLFFEDLRQSDQAAFDVLHEAFSEDTPREIFEQYLRRNKRSHYNFYSPLLDEIAFCIFLYKEEKYTSSFIHLYRALESISFAFPAIYIASLEEFSHSYKFFQDFFKEGGKDAGELAFFRKFIQKVFKGDPLLESSIDFDIICDSDGVCGGIVSEIQRIMEGNVSAEYSDDNRKITVKFVDICPFVITLRNRYFHNSNSGAKNIQIHKIADPDILFKAVIEKSLYCISTILSLIVMKQMKSANI